MNIIIINILRLIKLRYNNHRLGFFYEDDYYTISKIPVNKIEIIYPNRSETILIDSDIVCGYPITYIYHFERYLIRVTQSPFDAPFISCTNDIVSSVHHFMDKLCSSQDSTILSMLNTGHYTKSVYTDKIRLNFWDYLEFNVSDVQPAICSIEDAIRTKTITATKDNFHIKYSIQDIEITFNINKFLNDLISQGCVTKRAISLCN